ncbi:uncharacterized protein GGS25DRAFT_482549 [Hypoxylon fragiforme]|uniref:uncharacterized protein n=1 Tax=Hypoxylon fragiforme TaxID=63214 RepID=UPI0020C67E1F|nr:uncharacterized protein GGS25DRAFT_482549 [Hypoxylon fragiforme]KAI2611392.1 hypothetical protein GGS25DRAFT_482549 [Hypoxylon fragiforme]
MARSGFLFSKALPVCLTITPGLRILAVIPVIPQGDTTLEASPSATCAAFSLAALVASARCSDDCTWYYTTH